VAEIARSTGVNAQTLYSWRHRWKQEGQLVPASSKAPELWRAAELIQRACLKERYCRPRGFGSRQSHQQPLILHADNGNA
jgi:transposase-like protein